VVVLETDFDEELLRSDVDVVVDLKELEKRLMFSLSVSDLVFVEIFEARVVLTIVENWGLLELIVVRFVVVLEVVEVVVIVVVVVPGFSDT
jgi:hypothetical protein